ncbi:hypothetical protein [Stutzerimonas nitrititolerans]|uniref:hypothetical protein n=1 Tax=Stutzerimonas nitrititolerans TaxID=2482751 RepID=UPI0028AD5FC5|nr:hypothetical protein [Stutzerimonas nitrititolerans]
MPTIHEFASSSDAYDSTQCDESVRKGDALLIASEGVVGLAWTWPVAVTASAGELHELTDEDGIKPAAVIQDAGWTDEQLKLAVGTATQHGLPVARWAQAALAGGTP